MSSISSGLLTISSIQHLLCKGSILQTSHAQDRFLTQHFHLLFFIGIAIGLLLSFMYADHQILTNDQTQMIDRGYLAAHQGIWSSHGNVASSVGNVPGYLSTAVIALPLMVWDSPWAPMGFIILVHLMAFVLLDSIVKNVFDQRVRLLFLVLFWLNPWFLFENRFYNPAFLFFFAALHFWSAYHMREHKSFIYTFLHLLSIGMSMQLHYSWPILAVISAYLFYRGIIKVHWLGFISAAAVIIISLIPYFQEYLNNSAIQARPDKKGDERYIGWGGVHVYPVLKAFVYWFRYASFLFTNKLILGAGFEWVSSIELIQKSVMYLYRVIFFTIGAGSLWFVWKANKYTWGLLRPYILRSHGTDDIDAKEWISLYVFGVLLAILISASLSPIVFVHWHLLLTFDLAIFPLLFYAQSRLDKGNLTLTKPILFVAGYLIIVNLIASHDSERFSYKADFAQQTLKRVKHL